MRCFYDSKYGAVCKYFSLSGFMADWEITAKITENNLIKIKFLGVFLVSFWLGIGEVVRECGNIFFCKINFLSVVLFAIAIFIYRPFYEYSVGYTQERKKIVLSFLETILIFCIGLFTSSEPFVIELQTFDERTFCNIVTNIRCINFV